MGRRRKNEERLAKEATIPDRIRSRTYAGRDLWGGAATGLGAAACSAALADG